MKRLLVQAKPESVEDLTALVSLYRPGPMQFIPLIWKTACTRRRSATATPSWPPFWA